MKWRGLVLGIVIWLLVAVGIVLWLNAIAMAFSGVN